MNAPSDRWAAWMARVTLAVIQAKGKLDEPTELVIDTVAGKVTATFRLLAPGVPNPDARTPDERSP